MRTTAAATFVQGGTTAGTALIDLLTPEQGRLKLTVISDDSGEPAPAMVRLVWKIDGQVRRPDNGIDFDPQFDHQGRVGAGIANLPGKLRGAYWTVPGPIDMALPAGEWEVTVRRGVEHVAVVDTFTVVPGQTVERSYRPRRWVNMSKRGWYSGDDHVHAQILSEADAQRMMTWAKAEDVHLCNIVKMGDIQRTFFEQRAFGKTSRVVDGEYVLSPGQECPRTDELGHTLAMNITSMIRDTDRYFLYDWVFDQVHAQGGLTGYAHVLSDAFHVHRDMSINVPKDKIDFVELMQFSTLGTDLYYEFLNTGFKITASAGSDVPWGGTIGEVRTYALVGAGRFDADRWFEAVKQGHTFVTNGPMLEFTVDQALPGDQIDVKTTKPLHVKARVWGDSEASLPSKLEIVCNGETIKSIQPTDAKQTELTLEFDVDPANGFWIAARAEGADSTRAHTTPIYVVKPGLRFWKFEELDSLITKRLASLDEVDVLVKDRTEKNARGEVETNRLYKQLALQGPELMNRVTAARRIYEDLKQVADKERPLRKAAVAK
ncbi:MAG: CehA/McbA family metallohydrolase [Planctomycetes bacterium]|nr:CehA/McbA family metallohydrolase [Planctomycetota bacterium]